MEMLYRSHTMMSIERFALHITMLIVFAFTGCTETTSDISLCSIEGKVNVSSNSWSKPNGFKITLRSITDNSIQYIAVTGDDGGFQFRDIVAGTYSLNAEKEGYRWIWMTVDGNVNYRNKEIKVQDGEIKNIEILMENSSNPVSDYKLILSDIQGNPIEKSIHVPKYATTVSFKLYNATDMAHTWDVSYTDKCFVSDDRGIDYEYIFSSFTPTSGTLNPGDNVVLIGTINPKIWTIYSNYPYRVLNELCFQLGKLKYVTLNIDF